MEWIKQGLPLFFGTEVDLPRCELLGAYLSLVEICEKALELLKVLVQ